MASRKLTVEKLLRDSGLIHADDMPGLELGFHRDHYLDANGNVSFFEVFEVCHIITQNSTTNLIVRGATPPRHSICPVCVCVCARARARVMGTSTHPLSVLS